MYNDIYNSYNASSRDYNDMSRNGSREIFDMERSRAIKKINAANNAISCSIEKSNILKEYELKLINREEALKRLEALEQKPKEKKYVFFR